MAGQVFYQYTAIASGGTLSGNVELDRARVSGLWVPNSETSQVFLQVSWDTTSANFARAQLSAGGGAWSVASATTRVAATLSAIAGPFQYARVEVGAATTGLF